MKVKKLYKGSTFFKNGKPSTPVLKEKLVDELVEEWMKQAPKRPTMRVWTEREKKIVLEAFPKVRAEFLAKQLKTSENTLRTLYRKLTSE